ncbi:acyltransferase family protein [Methanobacterium sp. ACI-7]|uniref:acyltransferase family protein n=1 Tax=unclassified Methanobacterium TaxID=2627676 RepID=UPI0039C3A91A
MINNRKILQEIEIIRGLAIILIVLCHIPHFIKISSYQNNLDSISLIFAQIGLCLFFFVSGFILYYNYNSFKSTKSIINFYNKRLKRIFPLYWAALFLFTIWTLYTYGSLIVGTYTISIPAYISTIAGLQEFFFTEGQQTYLWFISVLIMYYLIYPLIIRPKKLINMLSLSSAIFITAFIVHLNFNLIEISFFKYYWIFIGGILLCLIKYDKNQIFSNNYLDYLAFSFLLLVSLIISKKFYNFNYLLISFVPCIIIYVILNNIFTSKFMNIKKITLSKLYILLSKISMGSYSIYLFHIILLYILVLILDKYSISTFYNLIIIIVGIPGVFIVGYYIQKLEKKLWLMDYNSIKSYIIQSENIDKKKYS